MNLVWRKTSQKFLRKFVLTRCRLAEKERWAEPRPEFRGTIRISPITGKPELYYPTNSRRLKWDIISWCHDIMTYVSTKCLQRYRYLVTFPIIFLCLVLSAGVMLTCFALSDYFTYLGEQKVYKFHWIFVEISWKFLTYFKYLRGPFYWLNDYLGLIPTLAYSVLVPVLNVAYTSESSLRKSKFHPIFVVLRRSKRYLYSK